MKNDFPLSNIILKVNITMVWLETPSNHHQALFYIYFWWLKCITSHNSNAIEAHK